MGFGSRWILLALAGLMCVMSQCGARNVFQGISGVRDDDNIIPLEALLIDSTLPDVSSPFDDKQLVKVEGDIIVTLGEWRDLHSPTRNRRTAAIIGNDDEKLWPGKIVNYEIEKKGFTSANLHEIRESIADISHYTCLTFRETSSEWNRIVIADQDKGGCFSYVGMNGGAQLVHLDEGCEYKEVIIHELLHAIGVHHEQTRPDRDDHVTILKDNILSNMLHNFDKYDWKYINDLEIPYDYYSIMHYPKSSFGRVRGMTTIETKNPEFQEIIGNQKNLSFSDIKTVNMMYNCKPDKCDKTDADCPGQGFVGKDCACWCPVHAASIDYCFDEDKAAKGELIRVGEQSCANDYGDATCKSYKNLGLCNTLKSLMHDVCKKACNAC